VVVFVAVLGAVGVDVLAEEDAELGLVLATEEAAFGQRIDGGRGLDAAEAGVDGRSLADSGRLVDSDLLAGHLGLL
jgi:hypothetical protein